MKGLTHLILGANTAWLLIATGFNPVILALVGAFGALIPDLDASDSTIKHIQTKGIKPFYVFAEILSGVFGHRGFMHSILGLVAWSMLSAVAGTLWGYPTGMALFLGYTSHLLADSLTPSGIPFFYPRPRRFVLLPREFAIHTGSLLEEMIFFVLVGGLILLGVRAAQGSL
jgi:membrane-bound metal-dependent hydrolase YbcI (DUF457 family)